MGVSTEQWRMRIGCFLQWVPKWKWTAPMIAILGAYSLLLRGVLLYMTCVNAPCEGTVRSEVYIFPTSHVYDGTMLHIHCQFDLTCETMMSNLNIKWQQSIHSGMLHVCTGDIELNPGPNERHKRTLTPQAVEPKLADIMKEMKSMWSDITKRLDTIDKKVEGVQKNICQIKTDQNELKRKVNALYDENRLLRKKLDGMEGQSRRNNIIVRGIPEKTDGPWELGGLWTGIERKLSYQAGDGPRTCR